MIDSVTRTLTLAALHRARVVDSAARNTRRATIIDDGTRRSVDSCNGIPAPLYATRYVLTTHHRRGPALSAVSLCVACASVAYRNTLRTLSIDSRARTISTRRLTLTACTSGGPCDACGRIDSPYPNRPPVHDPPDTLIN